MAIERRDPLPPARYSIFLNATEIERWAAWVASHRDSVKVVATIEKTAVGGSELTTVFHVDTDGDIIWKRVGTVVLFDVTAPTAWVGLGYPDIWTLSIGEWQAEHLENPEYIPEPSPLDELRNLALFGAGIYLGGILLQKALRS